MEVILYLPHSTCTLRAQVYYLCFWDRSPGCFWFGWGVLLLWGFQACPAQEKKKCHLGPSEVVATLVLSLKLLRRSLECDAYTETVLAERDRLLPRRMSLLIGSCHLPHAHRKECFPRTPSKQPLAQGPRKCVPKTVTNIEQGNALFDMVVSWLHNPCRIEGSGEE